MAQQVGDPSSGSSINITVLMEEDVIKFSKSLSSTVRSNFDRCISDLKDSIEELGLDVWINKLGRRPNAQETILHGYIVQLKRFNGGDDKDFTNGFVRSFDRILLATIAMSYHSAWNSNFRNLLCFEFHECVENFLSIVTRTPEIFPDGCCPEYMKWVFRNRILKLVVPVSQMVLDGKYEANELLLELCQWPKTLLPDLTLPEYLGLTNLIYTFITFRPSDQVNDFAIVELSTDDRVRRYLSNFKAANRLADILWSISLKDKLILDKTLEHALREPEKLGGTSLMAWRLVVKHMIFNSGFVRMSSVLDKEILPRLQSDNLDTKAKAAWMINVCTYPETLDWLSKDLLALLEFFHDRHDPLRKQVHFCWFRVLRRIDNRPGLDLLTTALREKILDAVSMRNLLTSDYFVNFEVRIQGSPHRYLIKVWLIGLAIIRFHLDARTTKAELKSSLDELISIIAHRAGKRSKDIEEEFINQLPNFDKIYLDGRDGEEHYEVCKYQLGLANEIYSDMGFIDSRPLSRASIDTTESHFDAIAFDRLIRPSSPVEFEDLDED